MMPQQPQEKSRVVREMFSAIAGRYDLVNHLLSANIDRRWRKRFVERLAGRMGKPRPFVLDIGCGTADLSLEFSRLGPVVGVDFSLPMLRIGRLKVAARKDGHAIDLLSGDALSLPFRDETFDAVVSAFVVRNLADVSVGLAEMRRVLKRGGVLGILEFGMPGWPPLGAFYRFYFTRILPRLGAWISGVRGPYQYLPASVRSFPQPEEFKSVIAAAGFNGVEYFSLGSGIALFFVASARD
jgi:demethylmenaquinone methyltransferase/2-methoxy-6-polyprenyl-1,4-benzoquinol methylase